MDFCLQLLIYWSRQISIEEFNKFPFAWTFLAIRFKMVKARLAELFSIALGSICKLFLIYFWQILSQIHIIWTNESMIDYLHYTLILNFAECLLLNGIKRKMWTHQNTQLGRPYCSKVAFVILNLKFLSIFEGKNCLVKLWTCVNFDWWWGQKVSLFLEY